MVPRSHGGGVQLRRTVVREVGNDGREESTCAKTSRVDAPGGSVLGTLIALSVSGVNDALVLRTPWWAELRICLPIGRSTQSPHPSGVVQMPEFSISSPEVRAKSAHLPSPASMATCPFGATHSTERLAPAGTPAKIARTR